MFTIFSFHKSNAQALQQSQPLEAKKIAALALQVIALLAAAALFALAKTGALSNFPECSWIQTLSTEIVTLCVLGLGGLDGMIAISVYLCNRKKTSNPPSSNPGNCPPLPHPVPFRDEFPRYYSLQATPSSLTIKQPAIEANAQMVLNAKTFTQLLETLNIEDVTYIATHFLKTLNINAVDRDGELIAEGSQEQLEVLGEILGRDMNISSSLNLIGSMTYLASQAIYQLIDESAKQKMGSALYNLLSPTMTFGKPYELRYLHSFSNGSITLCLEEDGIKIITQSENQNYQTKERVPIIFKILKSGQLEIESDYENYHVHEALITLLWQNIPLLKTEFDPKKSAELAPSVFRRVKRVLSELLETVKEAEGLDYKTLKGEGNTRCFPMNKDLPLEAITQRKIGAENETRILGSYFSKESSIEPPVQFLSPSDSQISYQFPPLYNPVTFSQDCTARYEIHTQPGEHPKLSLIKESPGRIGGINVEHMSRTLSFQAVPNSDALQVTIIRNSERGVDVTGHVDHQIIRYQVALTENNQWIIHSETHVNTEINWSINSFIQKDDGTWQNTANVTIPDEKEVENDLNYIIQCLISVYNLKRSPYTIALQGVGIHPENNRPTSLACVNLYTKINQGETQGSNAVLRREHSRLIWQNLPPLKPELQASLTDQKYLI